MRYKWSAPVAFIVVALAVACGDDDGDDGNGGQGPFDLIVSPEFVQGAVGDIPVSVLVTVDDLERGSGEVALRADFPAGAVTVSPESISAGEIAEVTITAEAVVEEVEATLTITAARGGEEETATRSVFVMPGEDTVEPTASDLLGVFAAWLGENHPDLSIDSESTLEGRLVAPRLLVVTHYMFFDEQYELGLSWHIMVPPDDWAELYIRPRDQLAPSQAFRVSSWSAALDGEEVEFTEVTPPTEVVR